jgi:RHS repeat-associated protein
MHGLLLAVLMGPAGSALSQFGIPGIGNGCDPTRQSCAPGATPPISTPPGGPGACSPSPGGSPCGGNGPAAQSDGAGINVGAGNPINIITGNKYQREQDMAALPGVLGLEIVRHYNSAYSGQGAPNGIVGRGWKLSYETDLYAVGRTVQIVQADGARIIFSRSASDPSQCASANPANGKVVIARTARGEEFTWTWTDGRKLSFNSLGKLAQIQAATGEFASMQHDRAGNLLKVTDPQGRQLRLIYLDRQAAGKGDRFRGVQAIDSPVGRFKYDYGSALPPGATADKAQVLANLVKVTLPTHYDRQQKMHAFTERGVSSSAISRLYHYEDAARPTFLTGITVAGSGSDGRLMSRRIASYGYDRNGLANLSVKGEPARLQTGPDGKPLQPARLADGTGIEQVTLERSQGGVTILRNSLAQATAYRHAIVGGQYRLLEVTGPGCASCGETNVRYGYDRLGRLTDTTRLDANGQPIAAVSNELDDYGRPVKVSRIVYRNGKPQAAQWQVRYEYQGADNTPTLIARPSVAPGQEHQTRIRYNDHGQPLQAVESGWSPAIDANSQAATIERSTSYTYALINGRSLLAQIDGPLPNGKTNSPIDSDITQLTWDAKGNHIVSMTAPGNVNSTVQYDEAGRIARVANDEGGATAFAYNSLNEVVAVTANGVTQRLQYDALGNLAETGQGEGKDYQGLARFGFDAAGRTIWAASRLGILEQSAFDTEGKLTSTHTLGGGVRNSQRYDYDRLGTFVTITDALGRTRSMRWNAQGRLETVTDALGREKRYRYGAMGHLAQVIEAANTRQAQRQNTAIRFERDAQGRTQAVIAANGATTRTIRDDFGRTTATVSADSGAATRTFDAADRLIAGSDANGNRASYEYDAAGRIARQTVLDAKATDPAKKQTVTAWRYEGKRLVAVVHPEQTERYAHNDKNQLVAKTVTLTLAGGKQAVSTTRTRYDEQGQLTSVSLPDGSTIDYQRNGQNRIVAIERSRIQTSWLQWLLPATTIVKDIERDLVGIKRFAYGNGIEAGYQRSREGALARIVYRRPAPAAGASQRAGLETLLGINTAHATQADQQAAAQLKAKIAFKPVLPGALGLPKDANALLDHRYLWDAQGNLLHVQSKEKANNYAYDAQDRLIVTGSTPAMAPATMVNANSVNGTGATSAANAAAPAIGNSAYARYFYDGAGNRLLAQEGVTSQADTAANTVKTAYAPSSNRWQGTSGNGDTPQARYDANGQPDRIGKREYVWDALGKLIAVRQENRNLATYRYNNGERIGKTANGRSTHYLYEGRQLAAELNDQGRITRQYVYLADQPIAVIDTPAGSRPGNEESSPLAQIAVDFGTVWQAWFGTGDAIAYLHNNHLGATELVTDTEGKPVWQAEYSAFGKIVQISASSQFTGKTGSQASKFTLNLRLPGQYQDDETGLYYNDRRYYDPSRGQYLTPDPLGLRGGINTYAYVKGNPLKYIDPSGLILFAFDGTGNDESNSATLSNVVRFRELYIDSPEKFYITGAGTKDPATGIENPLYKGGNPGDVIESFTGKERIAAMIKYLNNYADSVDDQTAFDIDITGFSRGSAQARDFANQIVGNYKNGWYSYAVKNTDGADIAKCQKVNFRFMGLFDTVLSKHAGSYQLRIPDAFQYVAQAVALNEYRGGLVNFPSESILGVPASNDRTRIERGFLGSHSDIGGGFPDQDLAKVALVWMVDQAKAAGVKMDDRPSLHTIIANPVLHDKSANLLFGAADGGPTASSEDRDVRYADGTVVKQRKATTGLMTYADTAPFITYKPNPNRFDNISGTVDAKAYIQWLNDHGYNINMAVQ